MDTTVSKTLKNKTAIIFDLFHTLTSTSIASNFGKPTAETLGIDSDLWNDHLMNKSKPRLIGKIKDPHQIIKSIAEEIKPDISDELIKLAVNNRIKRFKDALINIPNETVQSLATIKKGGKKIALCSNADVIETGEWKNSPMAKYFDVVVFSCEVGYAKPDEEIFKITLDRLNVSPEDAMFVGDGGSSELKVTKQMGLTTVMLTGIIKDLWPHKINDLKQDADFVIDSINELIER